LSAAATGADARHTGTAIAATARMYRFVMIIIPNL